MKETYTISLKPKYASLVLGRDGLEKNHSGRHLDSSLRIEGELGDDLYRKALEIDSHLKGTKGERLAYGSRISRHYEKSEVENARLFRLLLWYQHGAAEEFGTWYTDEEPNPSCRMDRQELRVVQLAPFRSTVEDKTSQVCALSSHQVGPLHFPSSKFVKKDIFALWGGEVILSRRLADLIENGGFSGGKLLPIWDTWRGSQSMLDLSDCPTGNQLLARAKSIGLSPTDRQFWVWIELEEQLPLLEAALWEQKEIYDTRKASKSRAQAHVQLKVTSSKLQVAEPTISANDPFLDPAEHCDCRYGTIRRSIYSRIVVQSSSWDGSDVCETDLYLGGRVGLFRPSRALVVSKRLFDQMRQGKMKRYGFEIVELV